MTIAESALPINQHQIDVAGERAMLKRIIEDHHINISDFVEQTDSFEAALGHDDRSSERFRHHHRFVARVIGRKFDAGRVGNQRRAIAFGDTSEAAAHDSHRQALGLQSRREK